MKKIALFLGMSVVGFTGCNLEPELGELVQDMLVQTSFDENEINGTENIFETYSTFTIREDTIGFVSSRYADTILVDENGSDYVSSVVNLVKDSVLASGFTEDDANADFAVNIVVLDNFSFVQTVNYPGYYSGYYGYYGYYYPYVSTYYSSYGTMVIEVVDIKNYTANGNKYKVIWKAIIGDLYATVDLETKTLEAITQAFQQSPYLEKN